MAGVGGVACTFVHGESTRLKERVELWQVPGLDGYGSQLFGAGRADFDFRAVLYDTVGNVQAWAVLIEALQGTVVSIVDDWAITHANCLIVDTGILKRDVALGLGGCRGELRVTGVKVA